MSDDDEHWDEAIANESDPDEEDEEIDAEDFMLGLDD